MRDQPSTGGGDHGATFPLLQIGTCAPAVGAVRRMNRLGYQRVCVCVMQGAAECSTSQLLLFSFNGPLAALCPQHCLGPHNPTHAITVLLQCPHISQMRSGSLRGQRLCRYCCACACCLAVIVWPLPTCFTFGSPLTMLRPQLPYLAHSLHHAPTILSPQLAPCSHHT